MTLRAVGLLRVAMAPMTNFVEFVVTGGSVGEVGQSIVLAVAVQVAHELPGWARSYESCGNKAVHINRPCTAILG